MDVETQENFIIPDVITRYMMLKDNQLLFLNPRDNGICAKNLLADFYIVKGEIIYGRRNGTKNTRMA